MNFQPISPSSLTLKKWITTLIVLGSLVCLFGSTPASALAHKTPDSVRTRINDYTNTHYAGWRIKRISPDPMCDGTPALEVVLSRHKHEPLALIFTPQGMFVQLEEDIPFPSAPSVVQTAATSKYHNYHIARTVERITLASGSIQYLFDLSKGKQTKEATFAQDGSMVCEH
ncbi:MAG: hypothetical protein JSS75_12580 [Bacteroidetes bacterium]|nr:hypothetical protein [Bacteroidota bacterium]